MPNSTPSAHRSTVAKPADFDEFWADVEGQAAAIPLNADVTPDPLRSSPDVEVFRVHYDSLDGVRIFGWYCLPRERSGPLPAVVVYPGYISEPTLPKNWAAAGYAAFGAAPRGKLRSNRQFNPGYPGLLIHNITDRNTYSYRGFYVDAWRVIDFLESRAEIDASRMGVTGGSQGGALTLACASLEPRVKRAAPIYPFLCDYKRVWDIDQDKDAYAELREWFRKFDPRHEREEEIFTRLGYIDVQFLAPRIRAEVLMGVGLMDQICPPSTQYAAFNRITSPKETAIYPDYGHEKLPDMDDRIFQWMVEM